MERRKFLRKILSFRSQQKEAVKHEWELVSALTDAGGNIIDPAFYRTTMGKYLIDVYSDEVIVVDLELRGDNKPFSLASGEQTLHLSEVQKNEIREKMHKLRGYYDAIQRAVSDENGVILPPPGEAPWI